MTKRVSRRRWACVLKTSNHSSSCCPKRCIAVDSTLFNSFFFFSTTSPEAPPCRILIHSAREAAYLRRSNNSFGPPWAFFGITLIPYLPTRLSLGWFSSTGISATCMKQCQGNFTQELYEKQMSYLAVLKSIHWILQWYFIPSEFFHGVEVSQHSIVYYEVAFRPISTS